MATILDISNTQWRDELMPAAFRGAVFHVESGGLEGGHRIVTHQFPKKDLPWSESMGRQALSANVRGYCISFPFNLDTGLYQRDYRVARDALRIELDRGGPGVLQLPTLPPITVVCPRYRLQEETRFGGFCTFDMQFVEYGSEPLQYTMNARGQLIQQSEAMREQIQQILSDRERQAAYTTEPAELAIPADQILEGWEPTPEEQSALVAGGTPLPV